MAFELDLQSDLVKRLRVLFDGYSLPNINGVLQQVQIYPQFLPQPDGITFGTKTNTGMQNYTETDYESKFPSIIVKISDITDNEENARTHSVVNVKILTGIIDVEPESQGFVDVLNIHDKMRLYLLEHRVLAHKFILKAPMMSKLLDAGETWPVYFGEMNLVYELSRPVQGRNWIYGNCG